MSQAEFDVNQLKYDERGLIPAIIQEYGTGQVLMLAYMNEESLLKTIETGRTWFFSRSRGKLWMKGETSNDVQDVKTIRVDCDQDALLIEVVQHGKGACHTGQPHCFHHRLSSFEPAPDAAANTGQARILDDLYEVILDRKLHPDEKSYTAYLFREGINKILKKVGEETAEVIIAAKDPEDDPFVYEVADLFYHVLVLMAERGIVPGKIFTELEGRRK